MFVITVTYYDTHCGLGLIRWHSDKGGRNASSKPIHSHAERKRTDGAGGTGPEVYVIVSGCHPSQDRALRGTRARK